MVGAAEGGALLPAAVRADKASGGALARALKVSRFTGKSGQMLEVLAPAGLTASRLLLVGLGKPEVAGREGAGDPGRPDRRPAACGGRKRGAVSRSMSPRAPRSRKAELAAHLAFGARLRSYAFDKYRTKNLDEYRKEAEDRAHRRRRMWRRPRRPMPGLAAVADGIFLARDLVNEPPNILYPAEFARRARARCPSWA